MGTDLNPDLFDALDWPEDLAGYFRYLESFVRWIPQQTDSPAWASSAPGERYAKEVSDRLAQFAREWGEFLDTPASFSQEILVSFLRDAPEYTVEESLVDGQYGIDKESNIPGSQYAESFANCTFVHYELPPSSYHRYQVPVGGLVEESYVISGKVYM
ncbi:MAG: phosphatidylserine decarboxylase, partial [Nocardioidaceae bacterium]